MGILTKKISEANKSFAENTSFSNMIQNLTGFTGIDVLTGSIGKFVDIVNCDVDLGMVMNKEHKRLKEINISKDVLIGGFPSGPSTWVGMSGGGKSTAVIQVAASIVDNWYDMYDGDGIAEVHFYNIETHTSIDRILDVTHYDATEYENKFRMISKSLAYNEIYDEIVQLAEAKKKEAKLFTRNIGIGDVKGEPINVMSPTIVIIDSIPAIRPPSELKIKDDGIVVDKNGKTSSGGAIVGIGNMDAMHTAKVATQFINEMKRICEDAKIMLIMINHIKVTPKLDMFSIQEKKLPFLKPGETIKGGDELIYQSGYVLKCNVKEKIDSNSDRSNVFNYGEHIYGIVDEFLICKSKSGRENVSIPLIFDSDKGFIPELSDLHYLLEKSYANGYGISGSSAAMKFCILPEITFKRSNFYQKARENPLLARAVQFTAKQHMISKYIKHQEPMNLDFLMNTPLEYRLQLLMNHTLYYPFHKRQGLLINDDHIKIVERKNSVSNVINIPNRIISNKELFIYKKCMENNILPFGDNSYSHKTVNKKNLVDIGGGNMVEFDEKTAIKLRAVLENKKKKK